jgi:biotin operon repressor
MPANGGELMAEPNGAPEEKTGEDRPVEAAQSTAAAVSRPLARDVYDWAARLTAEASGKAADYYWTQQTERLVTKLQLSKRALIGVVGVQGAGKSATMLAVADRIRAEEGFDWDHVIAVKVAETGALIDSFRAQFHDSYHNRVDDYVKDEVETELMTNRVLLHKAERAVKYDSDYSTNEQFWAMRRGENVKGALSPMLINLIPRRVIRDREAEALQSLIDEQRVILIDMPDYPKHDRRLIARDLDDVQGLWNRLMTDPEVTSDATIVVFIQKETFNHADHFLYGKMELIDLMPLTVGQLLEAYKQKWSGYAPFTEDALQYVSKMSRGVFRRFKRYIVLALEMRITEQAQADASSAPIDLEFVKKALTDEELMRDLDKELDAIFKNRAQKQTALRLIKLLSDQKEPISQKEAAEMLEVNEMAVSRAAKELEEHSYIKRTTRRGRELVFDKGLDEHVEVPWVRKTMEIIR